MAIPRTAGILKIFNDLPDPLKDYLEHFPKLATDYPWDVSLAYLFSQIELAQNMTIYGSVVRLHRVDTKIARSAVNGHHMTRPRFRELYKSITGKAVEVETVNLSKLAEKVRDQILHGKDISDVKKREAIVSALTYSNRLNEQVCDDTGFKPFGKMKGFKGAAKSLDKSTSRWVLTGIGIIGSK